MCPSLCHSVQPGGFESHRGCKVEIYINKGNAELRTLFMYLARISTLNVGVAETV